MARRKINVAYIMNDAVRRATFRKRRRGLLKKAEELATLCDVRACAVVYGEGEERPEVWPAEDEAGAMLRRFKDMPPSDQWKKMLNQEGFMRQRITKQNEKLRRILVNNQELQMTILMLEAMAGRSLHDLSIDDASALSHFLESKAKAVHDRIDAMTEQSTGATTTAMAMAPVVPALPDPVKVELPAAQRVTEWAPLIHNAPVAEEVPGLQMFFGGGGGLEEMTQPYMNNVDSTMMPYYLDHWSEWSAREDIN